VEFGHPRNELQNAVAPTDLEPRDPPLETRRTRIVGERDVHLPVR
jgi:hypothetical protein